MSSNLSSKLNLTSSLRMKSKPTKTFKSYVDLGLYEEQKQKELNSSHNSLSEEEMELKPMLHSGEAILMTAENVLKFNTHSEQKTGISGALFCTNFKLSFVTMEQYPSNLQQNNLLLGENDICLLNIDALFLCTGGKRKRLGPNSSLSSSFQEILEVQCKNFSIFTFSFKFSRKGHAKKLIKALIHHTMVDKVQRLFLFDHAFSFKNKSGAPSLTFSSPQHWQEELARCGIYYGWRVSQANEAYHLCDNLPECFVIPATTLDTHLSQAAPYFVGHRFPVWSWGLPSGACLVRMASTDVAVTDESSVVKLLIEGINQAHPKQKETKSINLNDDAPSIADIQTSFIKLKELCTPVTPQEFWEHDGHFLGALEGSCWLTHVCYCLKKAQEVAKVLSEEDTSVLIEEHQGRDLTCIVASLIQILLDPYARTILGFQKLIEKEWVAFGHPFAERLGHISSLEESPVFLLFLDCVWQLTQQCPIHFEYSETYLTTLWDATHLSLFDTFVFSSHKQHKDFNLPLHNALWNWSLQFSPGELTLFHNPLYLLHTKQHIFQQLCRNSIVLQGMNDNLLDVDTTRLSLSLWTQCYLRWIPAAQIIGGGMPAIFLWTKKVTEEIEQLTQTIESLTNKRTSRHRRLASGDMLFTSELKSSGPRKDNIVLTSAFPFSPVGPWDVRNYQAVPSSRYLHINYPSPEVEVDED